MSDIKKKNLPKSSIHFETSVNTLLTAAFGSS